MLSSVPYPKPTLLGNHDAIEWRRSEAPVPYLDAVADMESRVAAIRAGTAPECVWLLEHPPCYTAGTSARDDELLNAGRFPVYRSGRGGRFTYHGPGQRVVYAMLDLRRRGEDVRAYVLALEAWVIAALARFEVIGETRDDRVGIWVCRPDGSEAKIAAVGVRIRRWIGYHGVSINVCPDLDHFSGIVPCGLSEFPPTSLRQLGSSATLARLDEALFEGFPVAFPSSVTGGRPKTADSSTRGRPQGSRFREIEPQVADLRRL